MHDEKHNLAHEFPEFHDQIHTLKQSDNHFAKLLTQHDEVDNEIRRAESGVEPHCDEHLSGLKLRRLELKDALYDILKSSLATA